jgi:ferredoxin
MLRIDHDLCSGTGHCAEIVPDLFTVHRRRAWLVEQADGRAADPELLRRAAHACPWFAISYTDDEESA